MPTLSFEGETHDEIVGKVRRWLRSLDQPADHLDSTEAVERLAELMKDALSVVAAASPEPVAHSDLVKALSQVGYTITEQTARAVASGLNAVSDLSGGHLVAMARSAGRSVAYQMESAVARQVLHSLRPR